MIENIGTLYVITNKHDGGKFKSMFNLIACNKEVPSKHSIGTEDEISLFWFEKLITKINIIDDQKDKAVDSAKRKIREVYRIFKEMDFDLEMYLNYNDCKLIIEPVDKDVFAITELTESLVSEIRTIDNLQEVAEVLEKSIKNGCKYVSLNGTFFTSDENLASYVTYYEFPEEYDKSSLLEESKFLSKVQAYNIYTVTITIQP
ncbi:gp61 [Sphingomonas phage PAU]|uniref:gp61 n=1 Tax=Sphingomonas phage PAU TaxID=1150991 RepID=UPI00025731C7|nr:gp61 [Sphingomonas phage PAU]AFF28059.1 gp61 [Sphingomonas phage PAU]